MNTSYCLAAAAIFFPRAANSSFAVAYRNLQEPFGHRAVPKPGAWMPAFFALANTALGG